MNLTLKLVRLKPALLLLLY